MSLKMFPAFFMRCSCGAISLDIQMNHGIYRFSETFGQFAAFSGFPDVVEIDLSTQMLGAIKELQSHPKLLSEIFLRKEFIFRNLQFHVLHGGRLAQSQYSDL